MSTSSSPIFSGTSKFANDFQQVITRAVAIASFPLNDLNAAKTAAQNEVNALSSLGSQFSALQSAIKSLASVSGTGAVSPTVSDTSVLQAQVSSGALAGTYRVHVVSVGSPTDLISADTLPKVTDPGSQSISSSSSYTLTVGGSTFTINPSSNSLNALAQSINAAGGNVNATVINIGTTSTPDYRLAIESTALGNIAIQLNDGSTNLLNTISTGAPAQYQVNGQPTTPISSDTANVTIAPGLTVQLLSAGDSTITLGQSSSATSSAISSFVSAYNAVADELNQSHGAAGGALTGQSVVFGLSQSLRNLTGFTGGTGAVQNLSDLGLTFDDQGHLNFNTTQFDSVAAAHPSDVAAFFGSTTSGFLQAATNILTGIEDPNTGTLQQTLNTIQDQITRDDRSITDEQNRIDALQQSLTNQMAVADAAIASLESQVTLFTGLFAGFTNGNPTG